MNRQENLVIWHNPRCAKSRETLQLIQAQGFKVKVRLYLSDHPTSSELTKVVEALNTSAEALVRKGEALFKSLDNLPSSEKEWINLLVKYPILIQRPIVLNGRKAAIGRPPENILSIL